MKSSEDGEAEGPSCRKNEALIRFALFSLLAVGGVWILVIGKSFLIPLVLAVIVWYLVSALSALWGRITWRGRCLPSWARLTLSAVFIFIVFQGFYTLISSNVAQMREEAADYQSRLNELFDSALHAVGVEEDQAFQAIQARLNLERIVGYLGSALVGAVSKGLLILMYVIFIMVESRMFSKKLQLLFPEEGKRKSFMKVISRIDRKIKIYLGVKLLVSLITAGLSYVVMKIMGLDFAEFWAVLILVFNFIPYIGSAVATILPTLLALVQFETFTQAIIIVVILLVIQQVMGNFVEPPMMGRSLNISPLAVLLALTLSGMVWGIVGMLLCVPIAVIVMIVCSEFDSCRWLAVLLSEDGAVRE